MKRIIIHWTAGGYKPSANDLSHYHFVVDGDGKVHEGKFKPEANSVRPLKAGQYAAHTLNCNTDSIGISIAAMANAVESPFNAGKSPIKQIQLDALVAKIVQLCDKYNIAVTRETVLTHAEVQPTLKITQKGKWDISWLPGMPKPGKPVAVGDEIREMIRRKRAVTATPKPSIGTTPTSPGFFADLIAFIKKLLGVK